MIDFTPLLQPDLGQRATPIHVVAAAAFENWQKEQNERVRSLIGANRFAAKPGEFLLIPGEAGGDWSVAIGAAEKAGVWDLAAAVARLPDGVYRLANANPGDAALGWLLAHYRFDRYRSHAEPIAQRVLLTAEPAAIAETLALAQATALVRDLVNTPAADLGPAQLEAEVEALAKRHGARVTVTRGHELETGFPLIHTVGKAAEKAHAPRLIELHWGNPAHPHLAVIGKGISFDSGGLDIKPASGMRLMKKDMGGAAHAIALARLVIEMRLPVRLHLLIPAAENAISGNAFRPGDIIQSRAGLRVEIDNTDAEGRLVLADALTRAGEEKPELIVDFATLTGAARVALGPELPAMFCNDDGFATTLGAASLAADDPVWRLPLWPPYLDLLKSDIADLANAGDSGFAGALTAALFLQKFVPSDCLWVHLDTFAWQPTPRPGRPRGGEALGLRAIWAALKQRY